IEINLKIAWSFCDEGILELIHMFNSGGLFTTKDTVPTPASKTCNVGCEENYFMPLEYNCSYIKGTKWSFGQHRSLQYFINSNDMINIKYSGRELVYPGVISESILTSMDLTKRNDTGVINSSPTITSAPIAYIQERCKQTIKLKVTDNDGDLVKCRLASWYECESCFIQPPGLTMTTESCTLTYDASYGTGYKEFILKVQDFLPMSDTPLSNVTLKYIINVYSASYPCPSTPEVVPPTIKNGSCIAIPNGEHYMDTITADSGGQEVNVSLLIGATPNGLNISEVYRDSESKYFKVNITWIPLGDQKNETHKFCFTLVNDVGLTSEPYCIYLVAGISSPSVLQAQILHGRDGKVHPARVQFVIQFNQVISRPITDAKIIFIDSETNNTIHTISTITSDEVFFNNNNITVITNITFPEEKTFNVYLEEGAVLGISGCKPGNAHIQFLMFTTNDVTPPETYFIEAPLRTNENVTITWATNEQVSTTCILDSYNAVSCSSRQFQAFELREGYHTLLLEHVDKSNNSANISHTFYVDLASPNVTLTNVPSAFSNVYNFPFFFECSENDCTYYCNFDNKAGNDTSFIPCPSGAFIVRNNSNGEYTFNVYAVDDVGNVGMPISYTWTADFTPPAVSVNDTSFECSRENPPKTISAHDNMDLDLSVTFEDRETPCNITRTWNVRDDAHNVVYKEQLITKLFTPHIKLLLQLSLSCSSSSGKSFVTENTATVDNPCGRPLSISYLDEPSSIQCPGSLNRTWRITDACTGQADTAKQVITLYDICPSTACGKNFSIPHGICSNGKCRCNKPWYGNDCENLLYEPHIKPKPPIMIFESQEIKIYPSLKQGTRPVTWSLLEAPKGTSIDYLTGFINLQIAPAGIHTFDLRAANEIGHDDIQYTVTVNATYTARLLPIQNNTFVKSTPIFLYGFVEHETHSPIYNLSNGIVPISVDIFNLDTGVNRTFNVFTNKNSKFALVFQPPLMEYGNYKAIARHPAGEITEHFITWMVLGMRTVHRSVTLQGTSSGTYQQYYSNVTTLINDGPADLHNIQTIMINDNTLKHYVNITVTFGNIHKINKISPGEMMNINIEISTTDAFDSSTYLALTAEGGTLTYLLVNLKIDLLHAELQVQPKNLHISIAPGKQKPIEFSVTNIGKTSASNVSIVIAEPSIMSLGSFGLNDNHGNSLTLDSLETASGMVIINTPLNQSFGTVSGSIVIRSDETSTLLPFRIEIFTYTTVNYKITVEDEYTIDGSSLVSDARIRLTNYHRGIVLTQTTKEHNGSAIFEDIPEDKYDLYIEAPGHLKKHQVILASPSNANNTVFLQRKGVEYSFTIEPTFIKDEYIFKLEADYEVNIPIPVLTVDPMTIDVRYYQLESATFKEPIKLNITNHGLIRVTDLKLALGNSHHLALTLSPLVEIPSYLQARESQIIPVQVLIPALHCSLGVLRTVAKFITFEYAYLAAHKVYRTVPIMYLMTECFLKGSTFTLSGYGAEGGWLWNGGSLSRSLSSTSKSEVYCHACTKVVVKCYSAFRFLKKVLIPIVKKAVSPMDFKDTLEWLQTTYLNESSLLISVFTEYPYSKPDTPYINRPTYQSCLHDIYKMCLRRNTTLTSSRAKRSSTDIAIILAEALYPIHLHVLHATHILGSTVWFYLNDPYWITKTLRPIFDDTSDSGELVSTTELQSILNSPRPQGVTQKDIEILVTRFNTTQASWQRGKLEPKNENENLISYSLLDNLLQTLSVYRDINEEQGFTSYTDAVNYAVHAIDNRDSWAKEAGVCAIVRIQIEQQFIIVREGFDAILQIQNNDMHTLENIQVNIYIYDTITNKICNDKFSIRVEKLSDSLTGVDGNGTLEANQHGTIHWLIIPYSEAALYVSTEYEIGGQFAYKIGGVLTDIHLATTRITVQPDPQLYVHYFLEKYVLSDDPFTTEREPAIPFSLGVMISNQGFGTAYNTKMTSGQPEIIQNDKGLLISFQIIAAFFGSEPMNPSLEVDFGDFLPNTTKTARWLMTSSLIGEFKRYTATFENINPLSDSKLSIIKELRIHELIRNVRIPGEEDDGILDFLVNDETDLFNLPDKIYNSRDMSYETVKEGNVTEFDVQFYKDSVILEINVQSEAEGWVFFSLEDSILNNLPTRKSNMLTRHNKRMIRSYENATLPNENAWISVNVLGKTRQKSVNVLDYIYQPSSQIVYLVEIIEKEMLPTTTEQYKPCLINNCGLYYSPPHGICSNGTCHCNMPWYGEACEKIYLPPKIEPIEPVIILEGQEVEVQPKLVHGKQSVIWRLKAAPEHANIHRSSGRIYLNNAPAGNLTFIIEAENVIGKDSVECRVSARPTYSAYLYPLSKSIFNESQTILLTGFVVNDSYSPIHEQLAGHVPVAVYIYNPTKGIMRTLHAHTEKNSNFTVSFRSLPTEYGQYMASAQHPFFTFQEPQIKWKILGMRTSYTSVTLRGSTSGPYRSVYSNITKLINDGPADLHTIRALPLKEEILSSGIIIYVTFAGEKTLQTFHSGQRIDVSIELSTTGAIKGNIGITLYTNEGITAFINVEVAIRESRYRLEVSPGRLVASVTYGRQKFLTFNVTNVGENTANNVSIVLPNDPYLNLVSFGLGNQYGNGLFIQSNQTASASILVQVPFGEFLGTLNGNLLVASESSYENVPYNIYVVSDNILNLTVIVEDEYTYLSKGKPLVSDATVRLRNHLLGIDITQYTSDNKGYTLFHNLPEDQYEIFVKAPKHTNFKDIIYVSLKTSTNTIFLERTAVKFELTVLPTIFQDDYIFKLEADFEVDVPIPVVTVTPNITKFESVSSALENSNILTLFFNVTNHSLIRIENVQIIHEFNYSSISLMPAIGSISINAKSSEVIPVIASFRSIASTSSIYKRSVPTLPVWIVRTVLYTSKVVYSFACKGRQFRQVPIIWISKEKVKPSKPLPDLGPVGEFWLPGNGTSGNKKLDINLIKRIFCDPCTNAVIKLASHITGGPDIAGTGTLPNIVGGKGPENRKDVIAWGTGIASDLSKFGQGAKGALGKYGKRASLGNDLDSFFKTCLLRWYSNHLQGQRHKRSARDIAIIFAQGYFPFQLSLIYLVHVFGDEKWLLVNDTTWVSTTLRPIFDDNSDMGEHVSENEQLAVLNETNPSNITDDDILKLIQRFNDTETRWGNGETEPLTDDDNIMSYSFLENLKFNITFYNNVAKSKGFTSYLDALDFAIDAFKNMDEWYEQSGICAVVRIKIIQNATLVREGFEANLKIENKETENLENILVILEIHEYGTSNNATDKFSTGAMKLSGSLSGVDGNGTLLADSMGIAEWLIVPYSDAAPTAATIYEVGGWVSYRVGGNTLNIPLEPAKITVLPNPYLVVHYFWEKYSYSDDPFTTNVTEPTLPFSLGVMIKNEGFGTAYDMKITSGQPEIIENELGLLIAFQIIGALFGSEPINPSLDVSFGDLYPNTTKTARWWMTSSLIGEFKHYTATFKNINPLGDPKLSVIEELNVHELIWNVRIPGDQDDGILDFLSNDKVDLYNIPDKIYDSRNTLSYNVTEGSVNSFKFEIIDDVETLIVRVQSFEAGFTYFTIRDYALDNLPLGSSYKLTRHKNKMARSNDQELPNVNAWVTVNVLGRNKKKSINIFDITSASSNEYYYSIVLTDQLLIMSNGTTTDLPRYNGTTAKESSNIHKMFSNKSTTTLLSDDSTSTSLYGYETKTSEDFTGLTDTSEPSSQKATLATVLSTTKESPKKHSQIQNSKGKSFMEIFLHFSQRIKLCLKSEENVKL
ncbi:hypothetical protein SK128_021477, partial [Halocaridina rubra]